MLLKKIVATTALIFAATLVGALIAALVSPALIVFIENKIDRALSYEVWLRLYLGIIMLVLWWGYIVDARRDSGSRQSLIHFTLGFLVFLAVLVLDQRWVITEEMSWIRYPTAGALLGAGLLLLRLSFRKKIIPDGLKQNDSGWRLKDVLKQAADGWRFKKKAGHLFKNERQKRLATFILGAGLVFAAADELFTVHEKIGAFIQRVSGVSHTATDIVTVVYGLIGLTVLTLLGWWLRVWVRESAAARAFVVWYAVGMLLFVAATAFDTMDGLIFSLIRRVTDSLARRDYEFSDLWFIIWKPKLFLNAVEELFEYTAAGLFLIGAWRLRRDTELSKHRLASLNSDERLSQKNHFYDSSSVARPTQFFPGSKMVYTITGIFIMITLWLGYKSLELPSQSPFVDPKIPVTRVASLAQGLFHADDLDFHPRWGVVLANESDGRLVGTAERPGVFTYYKNEIFTRLPDPAGILIDIDSVAATTNSIYANSGALGKVLIYDAKSAEWEEMKFPDATQAPELRPPHPEAIAISNGVIVIADESERSLFVVSPRGVVRETPTHPLFKSPEGIVWHRGLKKFLITDDTTGTIFKYTPGKPLEVFAEASDGLRYPEDVAVSLSGDIVVSDNGRREIVILNSSGAVKRRMRLRGLYRDIQGVTIDNEGNLYFVTADAYESESFVPSVLWKSFVGGV